MKIVRVIARLNIGGPARHVALLADRLHACGYDTTVVFGQSELTEGSFEDLLGAETRSIKLTALGRRLRPWNDLRAFVQLLRIIFREQPDVVHTHTAKAGMLGRSAAAIYNATRPRHARSLVVHTFHGHVLDGYFGTAGNRAVRAIERTLGTITDRIVAIAPHQREELVERFHIAPAEKVQLVRLGLELTPLLAMDSAGPTLRSELGWSENDVVFGYVGRLVPIKNLDVLLRALARIVPSVPAVRLVVAGEGTERQRLEHLTADLGLADRVAFVGWRRDLPRLYGTFDIAVLSSRNEGTPVAVIEAMAAALPVVATRVGGVPDVVADGETGLLVDAGDADHLAAALIRLATNPEARRRIGAAARQHVAQKYGVDRLIVDVDRLYRTGLHMKRGASVEAAAETERIALQRTKE